MPSITENFEEEDRNAGDSVDFGHVTTRTKRRKRSHDPDRAFDGRLAASRSTTRCSLDAKGRHDTRNQYAQKSHMKNSQGPQEAIRYSSSSANLPGMEQGSGAGDYMNAVHEREDVHCTERDYVSIDEPAESSTSSNKVR